MERLQNVVFPDAYLRDHPGLFYHRVEAVERTGDGGFKKVARLSFDSYMNAFALRKWRKYTDIGELRLCLLFCGRAKVLIHAGYLHSYQRSETKLLAEHEFVSSGDQYVTIALPEPAEAAMLYFEIDYEEGSGFKLLDAYFGTPAPAANDVKIAIVTCTYRREQYVLKNLERFRAFLAEDRDRRHAFHWHIIDNGQTLAREIEEDNIHLIYNKNTGGAGGFARGMIESLRAKEGFTHVLLMDDDVEFFTESFVRTLNLMRFVKPEHRNAFVHASMFAIDAPAVIFETLAVRDKLWVYPVHRNLEARHFHNVLVNDCVPGDIFETPQPNVDSAWWYCCIPMASIRAGGLPLPVFIRGDDVEYSWRNHGVHHITLNGVCVWHEPFIHRVKAATDYYFLPRNMFIANVIHRSDFEASFVRDFYEHFKRTLLLFDYQSAEFVLLALEDVLRGPDCLREDPQATLDRLKAIHAPPSCKVAEWERGPFLHFDPRLGRKHWLLDKWTLAGLLCPRFMLRKEDGLCAGNLFLPRPPFVLRRRVRVLNELTGECVNRDFQRWRTIKLGLRFLALLWKIKRRYGRLREEFRQAHQEMTTAAFWERYLELESAPRERSERRLASAVA